MPENRPTGESRRYWPGGMDSFTTPDQLNDDEYVFGLNIVNRGGLPQTRPGTQTLYCLPRGNPQGHTTFVPSNGVPHHVNAIDGKIYVSAFPFREWRLLPNIQFWRASRFIVMERATVYTDHDDAGNPFFLDRPYDVLMFQDERTRAAYWDGSTSRHLNPTPSGLTKTVRGLDETKIGLFMAYSNSRLWISRGRQVFAMDLGNPLKSTESQYLNEAPSFYLPDDCTGMRDEPDLGGIICFHSKGADLIESSIIDRTQWLQTPNMVRTIFHIGCVAPRSVIKQHGLLYWFSSAGWVSSDDAFRANQSSKLTTVDQEMSYSKAYVGPDLAGICAGTLENYVVVSVPFCDFFNSHTWAMDLATFEGNGRAWNSVWTGWRPVQWSTEKIQGSDRCFFLSHDLDGENRVWEAFLPDRRDNGCPITCSLQTRLDPLRSRADKAFLYAQIEVSQLLGNASIMAAVASSRGWFERIMTVELVATRGRMVAGQTYGTGADHPRGGSNRPQSRKLVTKEWPVTQPEVNECGIESQKKNNIDTHFQLFLAWSGRLGISMINQFAIESPEALSGKCEANEEGVKTLMATGPGSTNQFPTLPNPFPELVGVASYEIAGLDNDATRIAVTTCAKSQISQPDADRKAACFASKQGGRLALTEDLQAFRHTAGCTTIVVEGPPEAEPDLEVIAENPVLG